MLATSGLSMGKAGTSVKRSTSIRTSSRAYYSHINAREPPMSDDANHRPISPGSGPANNGTTHVAPPSFGSFPITTRHDDTRRVAHKASRHEASSDDQSRETRRRRRRHDSDCSSRGESSRKVLGDSQAIGSRSQRYGIDALPSSSRESQSNVPSQDYFNDSVGEPDVRRFGSLQTSRRHLRYKREEGGRLLGLSGRFRTVDTGQKEQIGIEIAKAGQAFIDRYSAASRSQSEHLRFRPSTLEFRGQDLFVEFHEQNLLEPDVHGAGVGEAEYPDDNRERVGRFEKHLASNGGDVEVWLQYAHAHQIDTAEPATPHGMEVTLSILARALESVPSHRAVPLHMDFMQTAEAFWTTARLQDRWWALIDELPGIVGKDEFAAMEVLRGYLDWLESTAFGKGDTMLENVIEKYAEVARRLEAVPFPTIATGERCRLDLVFRLCSLLQSCGFREKASAIALAFCDITFFTPDTLARDLSEGKFAQVLVAFEDYWDSGYPRLGEKGARGWKHARPTDVGLQDEPIPDPIDHTSDPFLRWAAIEGQLERHRSRAIRANELDSEEDDPFRLVLFDEVRLWLFPLSTEMSRQWLLVSALRLLGLSIDLFNESSSTLYPTLSPPLLNVATVDIFGLDNESARYPTRRSSPMVDASRHTNRNSDAASLNTPIKSWAADINSLLGIQWFADIDVSVIRSLDLDAVSNVLSLCGAALESVDVRTVLLAIKAAVSVKEALKYSKDLLSIDRDDVSLWRIHARLEQVRDRARSARAIYSSVLDRWAGVSSQAEEAALAIWADWAMMEWRAGNAERVRGVLVALVNGGSTNHLAAEDVQASSQSTLAKLKARKFYQLEHMPSGLSWLVLVTLYHYYDDRGGLHDALEVCRMYIDRTSPRHRNRELAHQWRSRLLFRHAVDHPSIGSLAIRYYKQSIDEFPYNTQFLTLALRHESNSGLQGRVYAFAINQLNRARNTDGIIWAIWAFASHSTDVQTVGSASHTRMQSILAKALSSRLGRHCTTLWRLAIEFEVSSANLPYAKELLYRSLSAKGSAKELYMLAFQIPLRHVFADRELKQLAELMVERGLRVRRATSEFWEPVSPAPTPLGSPEQDEGYDELQFLADREASKPY